MIFLTIALLFVAFNAASQINPLPNAHAHNDYESSRPLVNALGNGFTSIEADVHLIDGKLYVSHNRPKTLNDSMLLENIYLKPLYKIATENDGEVYPGYEDPVYLMIDFKTEADETYQALQSLVSSYQSMLCKANEENGKAVKIFISGNRPFDQILAAPEGYLSLDGRPGDIGKDIDPAIMPVISHSYHRLNSINGFKNLSKKEAIIALATKAHKEGKKVRLWGAPDSEATWQFLLDLEVDLINTDKIGEFAAFMNSNEVIED